MIDVDISLRKNHLTNDFVKSSDKKAIASQIRNVLLLRQSDVTYKDYLFSTLYDLIGEDMSNALAVVIKEHIRFTIGKFIPSITLTDVKIGLEYNTQKVLIKLIYYINETSERVEQEIEIKSRN